jgi:RNA polymerase sigma-70 factor (ECF subfamily)
MGASLAQVFLEQLDPTRHPAVDREELERQLATLCASAAAAWPGVDLAEETFVRHLADLLGRPENAGQDLEQLHTDDLYLACACAAGIPEAVSACDAAITREIEIGLAKMSLEPAAIEEIKQTVREQLFVAGPDGQPYIRVFAGRGRLAGWARVIAVRFALKSFRGKHRVRPLDDAALDALAQRPGLVGANPEQELMKVLYRAEFKAAFRQAVQGLSDRDRDLLRQHFIEGESIDRLGERYGVHRATAARWLARARQAMVSAIRRELMERLRVDAATYESVIGLVQSRMDLSVRYLLSAPPAE